MGPQLLHGVARLGAQEHDDRRVLRLNEALDRARCDVKHGVPSLRSTVDSQSAAFALVIHNNRNRNLLDEIL